MHLSIGSDAVGAELLGRVQRAGLHVYNSAVPWFPMGYAPHLECYAGEPTNGHVCDVHSVEHFAGALVLDTRVYDRYNCQYVRSSVSYQGYWVGDILVCECWVADPDPEYFRPATPAELPSLFAQYRRTRSMQTVDPRSGKVCQVYYLPQSGLIVLDWCVMNPLHHRAFVSRAFCQPPYTGFVCAGSF